MSVQKCLLGLIEIVDFDFDFKHYISVYFRTYPEPILILGNSRRNSTKLIKYILSNNTFYTIETSQ